MKKLILIIVMFPFILTGAIIEDTNIEWNYTLSDIFNHMYKNLLSKYPDYESTLPTQQDAIRKRVKKQLKSIKDNVVKFEKDSPKYNNSIYAGQFHYENNETMYVLKQGKKTVHYFMEGDKLWKILIVISKDDLKKELSLEDFIAMLSQKHGNPFRYDYDTFRIEEKIVLKAYFKDFETLLEVWYDEIYDSFLLSYSNINILKRMRKDGLKVINKKELPISDDSGVSDVTEYDELLYESKYSSDKDDGETKEIFENIDTEYKKDKEDNSKDFKKKKTDKK